MHRATEVMIFFTITLVLIWATQTEATVEDIIQRKDKLGFSPDFLFSMMLLSLFPLIYIAKRNIARIILATVLGIGSYFLWLSDTSLWAQLNLSAEEQKVMAIVIWIVATVLLLTGRFKEGERKSFSVLVKREALRKQKTKCARCKRKLVEYGLDFDHRNGDRSNNKLSNCQVLCTPCHRRKHS